MPAWKLVVGQARKMLVVTLLLNESLVNPISILILSYLLLQCQQLGGPMKDPQRSKINCSINLAKMLSLAGLTPFFFGMSRSPSGPKFRHPWIPRKRLGFLGSRLLFVTLQHMLAPLHHRKAAFSFHIQHFRFFDAHACLCHSTLPFTKDYQRIFTNCCLKETS